jgi:hypothetical protein
LHGDDIHVDILTDIDVRESPKCDTKGGCPPVRPSYETLAPASKYSKYDARSVLSKVRQRPAAGCAVLARSGCETQSAVPAGAGGGVTSAGVLRTIAA